MTNTPRTDEATVHMSELCDWGTGNSSYCHKEAMMELELELVAAKQRIAEWKGCARDFYDALDRYAEEAAMLYYERLLSEDNQ